MTTPSSSGERILVVDDEPDIVALVSYHLAKAGYRISSAGTGAEALDAVRAERPALIVLDLMLPGITGFEVLGRLRGDDATKYIAVLMLTARGDEAHRVRGLSLGADDYLAKPFSPTELVLRVGAILRRMKGGAAPDAGVVVVGPIKIDRDAGRVTVDGREVELTATEFKLLSVMVERRGRVQSRQQLLETVLDAAPDIQTRSIDMHVVRLRAKLGTAGEMLETMRGFGYRLRAADRARG